MIEARSEREDTFARNSAKRGLQTKSAAVGGGTDYRTQGLRTDRGAAETRRYRRG
jgi:hypothetical protein